LPLPASPRSGVYMAAVTADPSGASAKIGSAYLTPFGYTMFVSPLKWGVYAGAAGDGGS